MPGAIVEQILEGIRSHELPFRRALPAEPAVASGTACRSSLREAVKEFLDSREAIVTAVERHDATAASHAVHRHLDTVERGLIKEVES